MLFIASLRTRPVVMSSAVLLCPLCSPLALEFQGDKKQTARSGNRNLPERVKTLEKMIEKQMEMIKEQQIVIETQKCLITGKKEYKDMNKRMCNDSLEDLIDREVHEGFDTDDDDVLS